MIGSIYSNSPSIQVSGGTSSTYINGFSGAQGVGNMRYNTSLQKTEVFDGNNWVTLNLGTASISLSQEAESLLSWAREKRNEEWRIQALAEKSPAVAEAIEAVKKAEEQVKIVAALVDTE